MSLYPLLLKPIFVEKIWGGEKISEVFNTNETSIGEAWVASGLPQKPSVVLNGSLKGMTLDEVNHQYKKELRGKNSSGDFPILVKLLNSMDDLSLQVHPDDKIARKAHNSTGKTEMWYILECENNSYLYLDFKESSEPEMIKKGFGNKGILKHIKKVNVEKNDAFFIPAGCFHSIGKGIFLAEIQQSSDITYRVFDFDRPDHAGKKRLLHIEESTHVFDQIKSKSSKKNVEPLLSFQNIFKSPYFTTNLHCYSNEREMDYSKIDTFIIYLILEGEITVQWSDNELNLQRFDCLLIPACIKYLKTTSPTTCKFLEIY